MLYKMLPVLVLTAGLYAGEDNATFFLIDTPYLSEADSQFAGEEDLILEDFEDGQLNTPNVTVSAGSVVEPGPNTDSVDADDGEIDGSGTSGHSYFAPGSEGGLTFSFDSSALPTQVGLVWTDGNPAASVTFEAFDANSESLGSITNSSADDSNQGTTAEDRFYGLEFADGISAVTISVSTGGLEMDHLQYILGEDTSCVGDIDGNDQVDGSDLGVLLGEFGNTGDSPADLDGNGTVDGADLGMLLGAFGGCP